MHRQACTVFADKTRALSNCRRAGLRLLPNPIHPSVQKRGYCTTRGIPVSRIAVFAWIRMAIRRTWKRLHAVELALCKSCNQTPVADPFFSPNTEQHSMAQCTVSGEKHETAMPAKRNASSLRRTEGREHPPQAMPAKRNAPSLREGRGVSMIRDPAIGGGMRNPGSGSAREG